MFNLLDMGFFRKKIGASEQSRNFRYSKGFCKHYGNKVVDGACIVAGICMIVPLALEVFFGDDQRNKEGNHDRRKQR